MAGLKLVHSFLIFLQRRQSLRNFASIDHTRTFNSPHIQCPEITLRPQGVQA